MIPSRYNVWLSATRVRFFWLLVSLIGLILAAPALPPTFAEEWESALLVIGLLLAVFHVSGNTRWIWIGVLLAMLLLAGIKLDIAHGDSAHARLILHGILLVALVCISVNVLSFVLDSGHVGAEHIYGGICAYIFIAMAFASVDMILEIAQPGSFSGVQVHSLHDHPWWQFFYFSMSTISTVGYGDILPVTMRARSIACVEQLVSVFYIAVLIARITGMYQPDTTLRDLSRKE